MLDDHGLVVAEVDPAWWWTPGRRRRSAAAWSTSTRWTSSATARTSCCAMAEAVGARSLNAAEVLGGTWSVDEAAEAFAPCATAPRNTGCSSISNGWRGRGSPTWPRRGRSCVGADTAQRRPERRHLALRPHRHHPRRPARPSGRSCARRPALRRAARGGGEPDRGDAARSGASPATGSSTSPATSAPCASIGVRCPGRRRGVLRRPPRHRGARRRGPRPRPTATRAGARARPPVARRP